MEKDTVYSYRNKPLLDKCIEGHEFEGHEIRLVGFKKEVFTLSYEGWVDPEAGGDQWLVYDIQGVEMMRVSVTEMIRYLIHEE